jgi:hypothetical protein
VSNAASDDVLSDKSTNVCVVSVCESQTTAGNGNSGGGEANGLLAVNNAVGGNDVGSGNSTNVCVVSVCESGSPATPTVVMPPGENGPPNGIVTPPNGTGPILPPDNGPSSMVVNGTGGVVSPPAPAIGPPLVFVADVPPVVAAAIPPGTAPLVAQVLTLQPTAPAAEVSALPRAGEGSDRRRTLSWLLLPGLLSFLGWALLRSRRFAG